MFYKEVQIIDADLDFYMSELQIMLINKTYKVSSKDYKMFKKNDKGKIREIYKLPYYPHRIIQWAIMLQIEDILLNTFVSNTFASIPNRGIHLASKRISSDLKENKEETKFCLKMDVKKFYPNINQNICKQLFRKKFKDKDLLWLIDMIIDSMEGEKGIAIGSLFSQWAGNFYLTYFDHWLKEDKKIKYYYRYCDDIVILHHDKEFLHQLRKEIEEYLRVNLDLELKGNWQVFPSRVRGIDFVGYRHFGDYLLLRKSTANSLKRKMKKILKDCEKGLEMSYADWCSINSYKGWVLWCNGFNLTKKYIEPLMGYANSYYRNNIQGKNNRREGFKN